MRLASSVSTPVSRAKLLRGNGICVGSIFLFSLAFPAADLLLQDWGVLGLILIRNMLAFGLILLLFIALLGAQGLRDLPWAKGFWIGFTGFGIGSTLLIYAQAISDPITAALAAAAMPISAVSIEIILDKRRLTLPFSMGLVLVLMGGCVATGAGLTGFNLGWGLMVGLVSASFFAWGSRASVVNLPDTSPLARTVVTTFGMWGFTLFLWGFGRIFGWAGAHIPPPSAEHLIPMCIYALLGVGISQLLWVKGVGEIGIAIASFHLNAAPFYVMIVMVAFGQSLQITQVIGAAILAFGVILSQTKKA